MRWFLPREEKFFELFEQQSTNIVAGARVLAELTLDYTSAKDRAQQIKDLEHAGDTLTHEVVRRLNTTFITPIDREDIHDLASRMDDVLDLIDAVADRLLLYRINEPTRGAAEMARIIVAAAEETDRAVRCLRTLSPFYHKHIQKSELGPNPANDGKVVRINIPQLTEERRKDLVKVVRKMAEEGKVKLRNLRRDANEELKKLKKDSDINEDELFKYQADVQKVTDEYIEKADKVTQAKEKEIMEI